MQKQRVRGQDDGERKEFASNDKDRESASDEGEEGDFASDDDEEEEFASDDDEEEETACVVDEEVDKVRKCGVEFPENDIKWYAFSKHKKESVAVISLEDLESIIDAQREKRWKGSTGHSVMEFFGRAKGSIKDTCLCEVNVKFKGEHFREMMRSTPFKASVNNDRRNKAKFFIAESTNWKKIVSEHGHNGGLTKK